MPANLTNHRRLRGKRFQSNSKPRVVYSDQFFRGPGFGLEEGDFDRLTVEAGGKCDQLFVPSAIEKGPLSNLTTIDCEVDDTGSYLWQMQECQHVEGQGQIRRRKVRKF
jgi:hypothetical protein